MHILITGAAGVLGRLVTQLVAAEGHQLRLTDMHPLETAHEFVCADLSDEKQTAGLCEGIEQVFHIAAIHPWKPYSAQEYLDCNIKGTYNVLAEAARAGVARVIYTSSVAAMGYNHLPDAPLPWDENCPCRPTDSLYSVTKHVGEQFCHLFQQTAGLAWLALRPGCFIPRPEEEPAFGLSLLGIGVHWEDVARAHLLALNSDIVNEAIIIAAGTTFTRADTEKLLSEASSLILRDFPKAQQLVEAGVELPQRITACYDITKARRLLGYNPQWTFSTWLERWLERRGIAEKA